MASHIKENQYIQANCDTISLEILYSITGLKLESFCRSLEPMTKTGETNIEERFIMSEVDKVSGLRTVDALQLLHTELVKVVDDHTETLKKVQWRHFLSAMRGKSSCFSPFSLVCFLVMSVLLFVAAFVDSDGRSSSGTKAWLIFEAFFLLISAALNCVLLYFQIRRRFNKHTDLKMKFLETLNAAASDNKWNERSYPMLHTPISPCISLQWVIRDGHLVNLPHPLLVEGDLIVMRPGLAAPGNCKSVEVNEIYWFFYTLSAYLYYNVNFEKYVSHNVQVH
ncbi:hypothetical protein RRG08_039158 [Elysia crispata]|uniref:Uncharacterized protein n=1 Tax=Elysia crispata TaxID=231223 RepID=A0AAE1DXN6_9GAST|nr:hypothetical protein RRG08_039158 [Elysia crispata]